MEGIVDSIYDLLNIRPVKGDVRPSERDNMVCEPYIWKREPYKRGGIPAVSFSCMLPFTGGHILPFAAHIHGKNAKTKFLLSR